MATTVVDGPRLEAFMGQAVVDLAAAFSAPLVRLGARLGLYRALAEGGPRMTDRHYDDQLGPREPVRRTAGPKTRWRIRNLIPRKAVCESGKNPSRAHPARGRRKPSQAASYSRLPGRVG
jgi:hypothetical protein